MKVSIHCPIGISGSGKSYLGKKLAETVENMVIVCPDDERKRLTGNISDQSQNDKVFSNCYGQVKDALRNNKDVYFSALNLSHKDRKMLFLIASTLKADVIAYVLEDSFDPDLCLARVNKDLKKGVERSNTATIIEGESIVYRQHKKFMAYYANIKNDKFADIIIVRSKV